MSLKGVKQTEEHKRKIGEANKIAKKLFFQTEEGIKQKKELSLMYLGKENPEHSKRLLGKSISQEHKDNIGKARRGKKTGFDAIAITDKRIKEEMIELEKQGFRCVPVGGKVRPDIIGIKDGKVYAIEVEYKQSPNYLKYNGENRKYFDDIIWINKHKYALKEVKLIIN